MLEREHGGVIVIEHDIGDAAHLLMTGDGDDWDVDELVELRVDEDEAIDGAFGEQPWITVDEVRFALVTDDEVKIPGLKQVLLDAVHDHGEVALAKLRHDDADREALARAQRASEKIGFEIELLRAFEHALASLEWNALRSGGVVDDDRDCGRRKAEMLGQRLQTDRAVFTLGNRILHRMS